MCHNIKQICLFCLPLTNLAQNFLEVALLLSSFHTINLVWSCIHPNLFRTARNKGDNKRMYFGDHSQNCFRQTSLLFHKWLSKSFNLVKTWIVYVGYKDTSISYIPLTCLSGAVYLGVVNQRVGIDFQKTSQRNWNEGWP